MKFILITNDSDLARHADDIGIGRIMLDLEINGKYERQGHLDTLISNHSISDIPLLKKSIVNAELLVRVNPLNKNSKQEIDRAINLGADLLMLPMFKNSSELKEFSDLVDGRVKIIPLVETYNSILDMHNIVKISGLKEIYIGLNDLHLDMGMKFMFEPLAIGIIDEAVKIIKESRLPFGFGGVARVGEGYIPGELILAEHDRLGSSSVILSRTFHRRDDNLQSSQKNISLHDELRKLNTELYKLKQRNKNKILKDHIEFRELVYKILNN
jgi:hypothetical protein